MNDLKKYQSILNLQNITIDFLWAYKKYWQKRKKKNDEPYSDTYITHQFRRMKHVWRAAMKKGAIDFSKNPFDEFEIAHKKKENKRVDAIGIEKLEKFESTNPIEAVRLRQNFTRDLYLFSFYNGGIRWGDLCRLKRANIKDGRLIYTTNKNEKRLTPKLRQASLDIIKKQPLSIDGRLFPIEMKHKKEWLSIERANRPYNESLKQICKKLGVPRVTFHTTRHSLVDLLIKNKTPMKIISSTLGHSQVSTTEKSYAKDYYSEEIDEAMDSAFGI